MCANALCKDADLLRDHEFEYLQLIVSSTIMEGVEPQQPAVFINNDASGFYCFYATEGGSDMVLLMI